MASNPRDSPISIAAWDRGLASMSVRAPTSPAPASSESTDSVTPLTNACENVPGVGSEPLGGVPLCNSTGSVAGGTIGYEWVSPKAWPFTRHDVELLEGMASHAAVALRAAQQLDDMSRARRTTAALLDIVQATSSDAGATMQVCLRRDPTAFSAFI